MKLNDKGFEQDKECIVERFILFDIVHCQFSGYC